MNLKNLIQKAYYLLLILLFQIMFVPWDYNLLQDEIRNYFLFVLWVLEADWRVKWWQR